MFPNEGGDGEITFSTESPDHFFSALWLVVVSVLAKANYKRNSSDEGSEVHQGMQYLEVTWMLFTPS